MNDNISMQKLNEDKLRKIYYLMIKIRLFEEETLKQYKEGRIEGLLHLYLGQEAIATSVCSNLRDDDFVVSTHRGHGHLIARGGDLKFIMAELFGKVDGYNRGKGGDMHISSRSLGVVCTTAIVGGGIPISLGFALSSKMKKTDQVTVCFFGDGASNQGTFHESLNLASIWNLPVVFICENSQFAVSTPRKKHQNIEKISTRAVSYNIPGVTIDGNDAMQVLKAAREAIDHARGGGGPVLLECVSYGWHQARSYNQQIEEWENIFGDPIKRFEKALLKIGILTKNEIDSIKTNVLKEVEQAVKYAEEAEWPDKEEIIKDIFI